jgi:hypothetical protein
MHYAPGSLQLRAFASNRFPHVVDLERVDLRNDLRGLIE